MRATLHACCYAAALCVGQNCCIVPVVQCAKMPLQQMCTREGTPCESLVAPKAFSTERSNSLPSGPGVSSLHPVCKIRHLPLDCHCNSGVIDSFEGVSTGNADSQLFVSLGKNRPLPANHSNHSARTMYISALWPGLRAPSRVGVRVCGWKNTLVLVADVKYLFAFGVCNHSVGVFLRGVVLCAETEGRKPQSVLAAAVKTLFSQNIQSSLRNEGMPQLLVLTWPGRWY
jgi:hypothetical protein